MTAQDPWAWAVVQTAVEPVIYSNESRAEDHAVTARQFDPAARVIPLVPQSPAAVELVEATIPHPVTAGASDGGFQRLHFAAAHRVSHPYADVSDLLDALKEARPSAVAELVEAAVAVSKNAEWCEVEVSGYEGFVKPATVKGFIVVAEAMDKLRAALAAAEAEAGQ